MKEKNKEPKDNKTEKERKNNREMKDNKTEKERKPEKWKIIKQTWKKPVCQMRWNLKCVQTSDNSKLSLSLFQFV